MAKKHRKRKQKNEKRHRETAAFLFALLTLLSSYALVVPASGMIGEAFANLMFVMFGGGTYVLPFLFLRYFLIYIKESRESYSRLNFVYATGCVIFASAAFTFLKSMDFVLKVPDGGWFGDKIYLFFERLFGNWGAFVASISIFIFFATRFLRISFSSIFKLFLPNKEENVDFQASQIPNSKIKKNDKIYEPTNKENTVNQNTTPNIISKEEVPDPSTKRPAAIANESKTKKIDSATFPYKLPNTNLLEVDKAAVLKASKEELFQRAQLLKKTLQDFEISAEVKDIIPGPVLTRYDLLLAPGIRVEAISNIINNLSLAMRTASIRVVPIPEKSAVGIEVPNPKGAVVGLRGILETEGFSSAKSLLTLALGKTTDGAGYITNLASMPHLLIAGATGSGKSVGIHTIILSILYKARPDEVKFMLIDPKRVEMPLYKDIPHLYNPCCAAADADIIIKPEESALALKKLVDVMLKRYSKFADNSVRNIEQYNAKMEETGGEKEFYVVVIIDELADLMLVAKKEIEDSIQRLAQMARAVGIHLILATQRPSVNVITGIIKANFPARLSFQTTSKIDSRVILDTQGAENLLGKGDMLFLPPGEARPVRLQGAFVSLKEAEKIIDFINDQDFPRIYEPPEIAVEASAGFTAQGSRIMHDEKTAKAQKDKKIEADFIMALKLMKERCGISQDLLKANFGSSAKAANLLSLLDRDGFISKPKGTNRWQINYDKIDDYLSKIS
ncbi:MAG: DNA translocase FtsK [Elusimicrobiota bacterium]|jgi:S-DNA-T family DNA segregation ATPase FtsK/SpoIIIE|nr:DNA translocase FtsK [Elusimicrobiota bacterium]